MISEKICWGLSFLFFCIPCYFAYRLSSYTEAPATFHVRESAANHLVIDRQKLIGKVYEVFLSDGTKCAIFNAGTENSIACDWPKEN
jgi:hypothetical protein